MKSSAEKSSTTTSKPTPDVQAKSEPFFSKAGSGGFFAPTVQAKLNIGKVGDHHEQEADNMAEMVVNSTGSVQSASQEKTVDKIQRKRLADTVTPFVQRQAEKEEPVQKAAKEEEVQAKTIQRQAEKEEPVQKAAKEEEVQAKAIQRQAEKEEPVQKAAKEEEVQAKAIQRQAEKEEPVQKAAEEEEVQAKFKAPAIMGLASVESGLKASKGKGSRLFDGIQADMEKGFGADFSSVRIHTGSLAVNMSKNLNALAFTNGNDIYFNEGKYNPAIPDGKILLAHELTHTIQQGAVKPKNAETITASEFEPNPALANPEQTAAPAADEATPAAMDQPVPPAETQQIPPSGATEEGDQAADAETDKAPNSPEEDPQFQEQLQFVEKKGKKQREHQPESVETANTKRAAKAPPNEVAAYSKGKHVGELEQEGEKAPPFSAEKFKVALKERIKAIAPESLGEMENFKKDGGVDRVKNEVKQNVENEKSNTTGPLEQKNEQPPDSTGIEPKDQAPMPARPQPPSAGQLDATAATPKPKTAGEWEQPAQAQVAKFDEEDLENEVDDEQLKEGHEPDFDNYLGEKQTAKATITENIQAYRSEEQETLAAQQTETGEESKKGLGGFAAFRKQSLEKIDGDQGETISKDEAARNKVSVDLEGIFNNTKAEVERILSAMETAVNEYFDREAISAQTRFVDFVEAEMDAYKDRRYSGVRGKYRKLRDWWKGLPAEANKFYVAGKEQYIREMDLVIDYVANLVVTGLNNAQNEVVNGRVKVTEYLSTLEGDLKKYGEEVAEGIGSKFDTLEGTIASKQEQMIGDLAKKYTDNLQQVNAQIEKWKEANKGMADKIKDLALGIWRTIKSLAKMLWSIVERIGNVVGKIIKAPVRFFKNLVAGISQGLKQFKKNIDKHLKAALFNWLFGTMTKAGIQLPDNFDLKGIFSLILQVLGLGMTAIRARAVKILGEPIVQKLEQVGGVFKILLTDGPGALIQHAMDKVSEMKEKVVTEIKEMVSTEIITAGITFVLGMLTPVGAFIKACKGIYNLIKFFIQRAKDIVALIDAVLNSIEAMIAGKVQVAADKVEDALARFLPLGIGFLASLVGIGGLADKVRKIVDRVRTRVQEKIIDPVIKKAYTLAQKAGKFLGDSKVGKMAKSGTAFVKQKAKEAKEKGKKVVQGVAGAVKGFFGLRRKFSDGRENHSIYFQGSEENPQLIMASKPKPIIEFLNNESVGANATKQASITQARTILSDINRVSRNRSIAVPVKRTQIEQFFSNLTPLLVSIAGGGAFYSPIPGGIPAIRGLPSGFDVRNHLYINGSGFNSAASKIRSDGVETIINELILFKNTGDMSIWSRLVSNGQVIQYPSEPGYIGSSGYRGWTIPQIRADISNRSYDVDHEVPLAAHWVAGAHGTPPGYQSDDNSRQRIAGSLSNLKPILDYYNRSAGSLYNGRRYTYAEKFEVSPSFSSIYNNSPIGAKKIRNENFV